MKIILSNAGGGKTFKVAELAAKYTNKDQYVQIISTEIMREAFSPYATSFKMKTEYLNYDFIITFNDIINSIIEETLADVVFIDGIVLALNKKHKNNNLQSELEARLKLIKAIEEYANKEFYVAVQANANNNILNGEELIVLDYEDYLKKNNN